MSPGFALYIVWTISMTAENCHQLSTPRNVKKGEVDLEPKKKVKLVKVDAFEEVLVYEFELYH